MTKQVMICAVLCVFVFFVNFSVFHHSIHLSFASVLASLVLGEGLYQLVTRSGI